MARPRKKPGFDPEKEMEGLIDRVASEYGVFDDRYSRTETGCFGKAVHTPSLNEVARKFGLNVTKTRKLLITAGVYSTRTSRQVRRLRDGGAGITEIMKRTGLSRASVASYLPYEKTVYCMDETSLNADRIRLWRDRKQAVDELAEELKKAGQSWSDMPSGYVVWHEMDLEKQKRTLLNAVWDAVRLFQGYWFERDGIRYRYSADSEGMHFTGMDSTVTREDIAALLAAASESGLEDKKAFYLYPVFQRLGAESLLESQKPDYIV